MSLSPVRDSEATGPNTRDSKRPRPQDDDTSDDENSDSLNISNMREFKRLRTQAPASPPEPPKRSIDRIPVEIWNEIFTYCLQETTALRPSIHTAPLLLGRVCHSWRDISLSTPELWSSLEIRYGREGDETDKDATGAQTQLEPDVETTRKWLERAKCSPLTLKFVRSPSWIPGIGPLDPPEVLDLVFGTMKYWRDIHLCIPELDEKDLCRLLDKHGGEAPLLERFLIDTGASEEDLPDGPPNVLSRALWNLAATSPVLRSLSVIGISSFINSSVTLNLDGYSRLSVIDLISQISAREALSILECATNIEYCSLSCVSQPRATGLVSCIVLPKLKDLRLQGLLLDTTWCGSFESILANITAPNLSALYLARVDHWPQQTLRNFLARSQCNLKTLALLSAAVHTTPDARNPQELIELLSDLPSLEYLWLDIQRITTRMGMTPREVAALAAWDKTTKSFQRCPNLRVVAFSCKQANTFDRKFLKALSKMVKARWTKPGKSRTLRKVIMDRLNITNDQGDRLLDSDPLIEPIVALRDAGLELEWDRPTEFDDVNGLQYDDTREAARWKC